MAASVSGCNGIQCDLIQHMITAHDTPYTAHDRSHLVRSHRYIYMQGPACGVWILQATTASVMLALPAQPQLVSLCSLFVSSVCYVFDHSSRQLTLEITAGKATYAHSSTACQSPRRGSKLVRLICMLCGTGGRQKDFVDTEKALGRTDPAQISALVGYAGGQVRHRQLL